MKTPGRRILALLPLALSGALAASSSVEAAQIGFGHFAPAAGTVSLEIDGRVATTKSYRGFEPQIALDAGRHVLRAVGADGRELAHGELEGGVNHARVVMLAGNGSAAAPYELRVSVDHNHPLRANAYSLQVASLVVAANGALVETHRDCGTPWSRREAFPYGQGSASLAIATDGGANVMKGSEQQPCSIELFVGRESRSIQSLPFEPGLRLRAFGIGDGVHEPYEVLVVKQAAMPEPRMVLAPEVAGLWYPAGDKPGISVVVAYDDSRPEGRRFSALISGFEHDDKPTWRLIDDELKIVEYRGGNPSGTHPALPYSLGSIEEVVWHSCTELTLVPAGDPSGVFNRGPRDAMRLKRLLPGPCDPAKLQPEVL